MPTREQELLHLNIEIEKLDRRLAGFESTKAKARGQIHLGSYHRTIEQRQMLIAARDRLLQMKRTCTAATDGPAAVPSAQLRRSQPAKGTRERGPDYETSRERVALEDKLYSELGTIKPRTERFTTVAELKSEFPDYQLWKILSPKEQEQLLTEEFKPRTYARTLVTRQFGLTNPETIKKDRQKLRNRSK